MPIAFVLFFYSDVTTTLTTHEAGWYSFGFITILAILGTVLASILYYQLVHLTGAVISSFVSYLVPIVATIWGFVDGEPITIFSMIGMVLILTGVYIARK